METETNVLELLVKLASLGAAGIGILGIFYTAIIVKSLPNNVTPERLKSVRLLTRLCTITVIVCGIAGICNSYFNMKKIQNAKKQVTEITNQYDSQVKDLLASKAAISKDLIALQKQLASQLSSSPQISNDFKSIGDSINSLSFKPMSSIIPTKPKRRIHR